MHLLRRNTGRSERRSHVSYANIVATLALVVAVGGGTAWAATHHRHHHYLITGTGQIKPKVLKKLHGANGANGTPGAAGAVGAKGATGPTGPTGASGAVGVTTGNNSNVTLSAIRSAVVDAVAPNTGSDLVTAQIGAHLTFGGTASATDSIGCVINNITSAPGTDIDPVSATFPDTGATQTSDVDLPLQAVVAVKAGDTVAVACIGGSLGYAVDTANIALIPIH
jgi:hypothetical protein